MAMNTTVEPLLDERECARQLGASIFLLRRWRQQGTGIPYMKIGRLVRYDPNKDLPAFLNSRRVESSEVRQ